MEPDASSSVRGRLGKGELLSYRPYPADDPCFLSLRKYEGLVRIAVPRRRSDLDPGIRRAVRPNPPEYRAGPPSMSYPSMVALVYFSPTMNLLARQ
jgi:hypothetical protein